MVAGPLPVSDFSFFGRRRLDQGLFTVDFHPASDGLIFSEKAGASLRL
jgi:hypothetical protein